MPAPLVGLALGAAARIAAKKTATKAAKASARGLKAAKKPTNRTGTKADRAQRAELQGQTNIIKNASPARANRTRGGSLAAQKEYGGFGVATAKLSPKQAARQAEITKELNPVRKKSTVSVKKKTTVAAPKSNVRVKPAAKQIGNPPNQSKALEEMISSVSRGSIRQGGSAGKAKTTRKFNSKKK